MSDKQQEFETAIRAFELFTMDEKKAALEQFSHLRYPLIEDRLFEAVYRVLRKPTSSDPVGQR